MVRWILDRRSRRRHLLLTVERLFLSAGLRRRHRIWHSSSSPRVSIGGDGAMATTVSVDGFSSSVSALFISIAKLEISSAQR